MKMALYSSSADCFAALCSARSLTNGNRDRTTPGTIVPRTATQPVAYGEHIATSRADRTDLETHIDARAPDCMNGQMRQRGSTANGRASQPHRAAAWGRRVRKGRRGRRVRRVPAAHVAGEHRGEQHHGRAVRGPTAPRIAASAQTRLAIPQRFSSIPSGHVPSMRGQVVEHGGAYLRRPRPRTTAGGTGPDGDATNWVQLSQLARHMVGGVVSDRLIRTALRAAVGGDRAGNDQRSGSGRRDEHEMAGAWVPPTERGDRLVEHVDPGFGQGQQLRPYGLLEHHLYAPAGVGRERRSERLGSRRFQSGRGRPDHRRRRR